MHTVTSFSASALRGDQLNDILADYVALDRARVYRRLLVVRFGALVALAALVALFLHGISVYARWVPIGLFAVPPAWAWIAEMKLEVRLSRRLREVDGAVTTRLEHEKVIKSS